MAIWQAILLGLVQGLTEFLPVSSSGHLVLLQRVFRVEEPGLLLDTLFHLGSLVAVLYVFWSDVWAMLKKPFSKPVYFLVLATIPAVVAALLLGDFFDYAYGGALLGFGFLMTSAVLFLSGRMQGHGKAPSYKSSLVMGLFQALAILPGLSRSGSTISGGLFMGLDREEAARFSFLMSIPAILGSLVFQTLDLSKAVTAPALPFWPVFLGALAAALSSLFAIRLLLRILRKANLRGFALYTLALGILVLIDQFATHFFF
ncbi:MAG: undecaprenyl-diphosphate phosphatase [Christensenellaceae bacterium]|jgi:undecaprenyl-diphosphatase|nr:undecaprenyl-diphosphate phosphatase [Christensenellaceae bacterium]